MSRKLPISTDGGHGLPDLPQGQGMGMQPYAPPAPPAGAGAPFEMPRRLLGMVLRYKWLLLGMTVLGAGVGVVLARFQPLVYEAQATLWTDQPASIINQSGGPIRQGPILGGSGWVDLLHAPPVLLPVIREKRLYLSHPAVDSALFRDFDLTENVQPGRYRIAREATGYALLNTSGTVVDRAAWGEALGEVLGFEWTPPPGALVGDRTVEFGVAAPTEVLARLRRQLNANVTPDGFMDLRMRGANRVQITRTLNAVIDQFHTTASEIKSAKMREDVRILQDQLVDAQQNLANAETALEVFKVETATQPTERGVIVPSGISMTESTVYQSYFTRNAELDQLRRDKEAIERALTAGLPPSGLVTALEIIPEVRKSTPLMSALGEMTSAESSLRALQATFTPEWPEAKRQQAHIDSLATRVVPRLARGLLSEIDLRVAGLAETVEASGRELRNIPRRSIREEQLNRTRDLAASLYGDVAKSYQVAEIAAQTNAVPDVQVIDTASVPFTPVADPRPRMILMCVMGALGLGLAGAFLRDRMDPRLRYPDEVTAGMGLNILGAVPALRRGRMGTTDMALAVEAFRAIQFGIVHAHGSAGPIMVTFTSPGASDGKSFVASNLAIAFADMGYRTLLVDGDVRRGTLHRLLGTDSRPGLTDYLAGEVSRSAVVYSTRYANLELIPCGTRTSAGPKLLGGPPMAELMAELKRQYDVILVDSPPLGACVDPMILSTLTQNLVLVLRTGATDRTLAESKLDLLDRLPVRVLGAILNDVSASGPYRYYSYMSGYEAHDEIENGDGGPRRIRAGEVADADVATESEGAAR